MPAWSTAYAFSALLKSTQRYNLTFNKPPILAVEPLVGRSEELEQLRTTLLPQNTGQSVAILHGLGGIGKTQLAVHFARSHKEAFTAILWIDGNSVESIEKSFVDIAIRLVKEHSSLKGLKLLLNHKGASNAQTPAHHPVSTHDINLAQIVDHVRDWLLQDGNSRWLMIIDSVDNPKLPGSEDSTAVDLQQYLPQSDTGSILITTRSFALRSGKTVEVGRLSKLEDSISILEHASERSGLKPGMNK